MMENNQTGVRKKAKYRWPWSLGKKILALVVAAMLVLALRRQAAIPPVVNLEKVPTTQVVPKKRFDENNDDYKEDDNVVLTFVRTRKTGSTSMIIFLREFSGLLPVQHAIVPASSEDAGGSGVPPALASQMHCMFGRIPRSVHVNKDRQCPHIDYHALRSTWEKLPIMDPSLSSSSRHYSFKAFTIVREPFDQLRSYFYFVRKRMLKDSDSERNANDGGYPTAKFTEEQHRHLVSGDFASWLQVLHVQDQEGKLLIRPYQFLDRQNVDKAIALIEGDSPDVIVLINECYETSLRLLETIRPFPAPRAIDTFLQSGRIGRENQDYDKDEATPLREKAKIWFADDYKFYNAAVKQFRKFLSDNKLAINQTICSLPPL